MRAAVCHAFGAPLQIEEISIRPPGPGEVGVRLHACAICHSDLSFLHGIWGGTLPAVYGHEAAGVVETIGPGVHHVSPGDTVAVTLVRSCGRCALCLRGQPALCEEWPGLPISKESPLADATGAAVHQGLRTGGFAEHALVDSSQVVGVPADIPPDRACLLACGVITGFGAIVNTARVEAGSSVGVIGTGGVGMNVVQGAVVAGATSIVAVDVVAEKLTAAPRFGATATVDARREDVPAAVDRLTRGKGLDYVFVTAGVTAAVEQGLDLLRRGGALVLIGMPPTGATASLDVERIADQGLRILGSKMGSTRPQLDIPYLVDLYRQGRLLLDELISERYPLAEINAAVAAAEQGEALRPVVLLDR